MSGVSLFFCWVFFSFPSFHSDLTQIPTRIIMAKVGWKLCYCIGDKSHCSWETRSSTNLLSPAVEQMLKGKGRHYRLPEEGIKSIPSGHPCKHTHTHASHRQMSLSFPSLTHTHTVSVMSTLPSIPLTSPQLARDIFVWFAVPN